jgi:hypothetical protein
MIARRFKDCYSILNCQRGGQGHRQRGAGGGRSLQHGLRVDVVAIDTEPCADGIAPALVDRRRFVAWFRLFRCTRGLGGAGMTWTMH